MGSFKTQARFFSSGFFIGAVLLSGCAAHYVIPESLDQQVDRTITFVSLQADPEIHKGRILSLGGAILEVKNLKEGTQIEVLHLPLDRYDRPAGGLVGSEGRFLVLHKGYLEKAVLRKGHRITVVGEVVGKKMQMIDEVEYTYPYLEAKFIHIWPEVQEYAYYPPYAYPYPYYYPYWDPWRPYWYPWGPPVIIVPEDTGQPPKRQFDPTRRSSPSSKSSDRDFNKSN
jgi:outer membrane lipoprotein